MSTTTSSPPAHSPPPPRSVPVSVVLFERRHALIKSIDGLEKVLAMIEGLAAALEAAALKSEDFEAVVARLRPRIDRERAEVARIDAVILKAEGEVAA